MKPNALLSTLCVAVVALSARADSLNVGGLPINNISIDKIQGDTLYYKSQAGTSSDRQINDKLKINIADEPSLNAAEDAYATGKWADATDGYARTLKSTNKPWLKDFAALRLMTASDKANRFDAGVTAWLSMLERDPKVAGAHKPKLPADPASTYLKTGLTQLDSAATTEKNPDKLTSIRALELEIARAMKDDAKITALAGQLAKSGMDGSSNQSAATVQAVVEGQLGLVKVALDKKDFAGAIQKLEPLKASITEPAQVNDWLWLDAEALGGQAADAATAKDAALAYMRVVAVAPGDPRTPLALLRTAALLEKADEKPTALRVYEQVARDYNNQPAGKEAAAGVGRLKGAGK